MIGFEPSPTLGDRSQKRVDVERLRLLGRMASNLYSSSNVPLTEAVVTVLKDEDGLTDEHKKRVTEFANLYAFDNAFSKQEGHHRVVNFERGPANPQAVIAELKGVESDGGERSVAMRQPTSYVPGLEGVLASMPVEKAAKRKVASQSTPSDLVGVYDNLRATQDTLSSRLSSLEVAYNSAANSLCKEAKQAIFGGVSPADVSYVVSNAIRDSDIVKLALKVIHRELEDQGLTFTSSTKVASQRIVNTHHPLFGASEYFAKVAEQRFVHAAAIERVQSELKNVHQMLGGSYV